MVFEWSHLQKNPLVGFHAEQRDEETNAKVIMKFSLSLSPICIFVISTHFKSQYLLLKGAWYSLFKCEDKEKYYLQFH